MKKILNILAASQIWQPHCFNVLKARPRQITLNIRCQVWTPFILDVVQGKQTWI